MSVRRITIMEVALLYPKLVQRPLQRQATNRNYSTPWWISWSIRYWKRWSWTSPDDSVVGAPASVCATAMSEQVHEMYPIAGISLSIQSEVHKLYISRRGIKNTYSMACCNYSILPWIWVLNRVENFNYDRSQSKYVAVLLMPDVVSACVSVTSVERWRWHK